MKTPAFVVGWLYSLDRIQAAIFPTRLFTINEMQLAYIVLHFLHV
jgi:hypothetical protein